MLAFRVRDLSVSGSRVYDRMNARVGGDYEGYTGAEEVFGIRHSEDVMAKGRILAGVVHRSGILVEGDMRLGNAEVYFGYDGVWEALPDFSRVEGCPCHDVGGVGVGD